VINRRKLLFVLGAGIVLPPSTSFAQQQGKVWRVGFLAGRQLEFVDSDNYYGPFRQGMRELGYVEGKNLSIEWRSAAGNDDRLAFLASELVTLKVDVIVVAGSPATSAAQKATHTIPIVMGNIADPVESGFVKTLARPGTNVTGVSSMSADVSIKQLEMLINMVPQVSRVAVLMNPSNIGNLRTVERVNAAAYKRDVHILRAEAKTAADIGDAFSFIRQQRAGALIVALDSVFTQEKSQIAALIAKYQLPSIAPDGMYPEAGVLMSYGPSIGEQYRHAATYVHKILKGANPANLPVEQPTKFELVINRRTAHALGLKVPQALLTSADKVIE